ncbi:hypothetical protein Shyhy01_57000 [Streptomyces hygroscopicus subsp. hygroscopicus]|nr:hypothetical protein Shyhy01_57000 [Streptomyces hygroscopicus subsp. hygroscopicus]
MSRWEFVLVVRRGVRRAVRHAHAVDDLRDAQQRLDPVRLLGDPARRRPGVVQPLGAAGAGPVGREVADVRPHPGHRGAEPRSPSRRTWASARTRTSWPAGRGEPSARIRPGPWALKDTWEAPGSRSMSAKDSGTCPCVR